MLLPLGKSSILSKLLVVHCIFCFKLPVESLQVIRDSNSLTVTPTLDQSELVTSSLLQQYPSGDECRPRGDPSISGAAEPWQNPSEHLTSLHKIPYKSADSPYGKTDFSCFTFCLPLGSTADSGIKTNLTGKKEERRVKTTWGRNILCWTEQINSKRHYAVARDRVICTESCFAVENSSKSEAQRQNKIKVKSSWGQNTSFKEWFQQFQSAFLITQDV